MYKRVHLYVCIYTSIYVSPPVAFWVESFADSDMAGGQGDRWTNGQREKGRLRYNL